MSFFKRLFRSAASHAESSEDPVLSAQRGLNDLKQSLGRAVTGLSEVRGLSLRSHRDADKHSKIAEDFGYQAKKHLKRFMDGEVDQPEAERLATIALEKKAEYERLAEKARADASRIDETVEKLDAEVNRIKAFVKQTEGELLSIRARARTAAASKRIGQVMAEYDPSNTLRGLEEMRALVEENEALAAAYGRMAEQEADPGAEIDRALNDATENNSAHTLARMKKELGIE